MHLKNCATSKLCVAFFVLVRLSEELPQEKKTTVLCNDKLQAD